MKNRSRYQHITQTSYPAILKGEDGEELVLSSQTEIVLARMVLDLVARVDFLEQQAAIYNQKINVIMEKQETLK